MLLLIRIWVWWKYDVYARRGKRISLCRLADKTKYADDSTNTLTSKRVNEWEGVTDTSGTINLDLYIIEIVIISVRSYAPIHGYVCIVLCFFGIVTNLVHVLVLTRPTMRSSAVNCILTAVAICDMGTMASYMIYIFHFVLARQWSCTTPIFTFAWMQFLVNQTQFTLKYCFQLWHVVLSIALHTTSLWLAVAMAFIRRMTLRVARLNSDWQRPINAWRICIIVYGCVFALCIPTMLVHDIVEYPDMRWKPQCAQRYYDYYDLNYSAPIFTIKTPDFALENGCRWFKANLWTTGLAFKVVYF